MAITRIGAACADAATITIPGSFQNGDLGIIYAYKSSVTAPTLPAGWTNLSTISGGATSTRAGYRILTSGADTSGTWTGATGIMCAVYRGVATDQTPVVFGINGTGTSATINYNQVPAITEIDSWVVAFAANATTTSTIETAPSGLTNKANVVGAAAEYAIHDSNGAYTAGAGQWPQTSVSVGVSAEYRTAVLYVIAEHLKNNNYGAVKSSSQSVLSFGERIR